MYLWVKGTDLFAKLGKKWKVVALIFSKGLLGESAQKSKKCNYDRLLQTDFRKQNLLNKK